MKYIIKGIEPDNFITWKSCGTKIYDNLRNPIKADLKNALLSEQGYICCYCESKISSNNSHIEHLDPQCNNNSNDLDFTNLLCSCQKQLSAGEPRHCGNSKDNDTISIHPLQNTCESKFTYREDGTIQSTDIDSRETIEYLKLDIDKLNDLRKSAIEPFIIDPITLKEISQEDAKIFANSYLTQDNGKYNEFYTTIKYLFG
jgi:uncharacterized protein (TIGR02646 family)